METKTEAQNTSQRHPDLDWLRVLVVLILIPFHTAMTFAPYPWYLRNDELNLATMALKKKPVIEETGPVPYWKRQQAEPS